jgi:uncharacterized protein YfaS (alpha-2-macroglobulin family)
MNRTVMLALLIALTTTGLVYSLAADTQPAKASPADRLQQADKLMGQGNWQEAYDVLEPIATDKETPGDKAAEAISKANQCLANLNLLNKLDGLLEASIASHADSWVLLHRAAMIYRSAQPYGFMIAGEFERGHHRGGGKQVNSFQRDRTRALQLFQQALANIPDDADKSQVAQFFVDLADTVMHGRGGQQSWRLQYLTDLSELPDYDEGGWWWGYYHGALSPAPVGPDGEPVYYYLPAGWSKAANDGERWRWALMQAAEYDAGRAVDMKWRFAQFLHNQFGVQTMAYYGRFWGRPQSDDETDEDTSGTYELHTLKDTETIAKLATGVRRFTLPDEFNFVKLYRELSTDHNYHPAADTVARIYENRRQYPKAAQQWKKNIARFGGGGRKDMRGAALAQIVEPWGMFEPVMTQPAGGKGATVNFRFRNSKQARLVAHEIKVEQLLSDVKDYLKSKPKELDWQKLQVENIGHRLVTQNQDKYIGEKVAQWELPLEPRDNHFDKIITVQTPLKKAGAYLLSATMADGNTAKVILWIADTAIVAKPLDGEQFIFVADAATGKPIADANVEYFGYWQEYHHQQRGRGWYEIHTRNFAEKTDEDGQIIRKLKGDENRYQWLLMARTDEGRFAYMGWTHTWVGNWHDREYNAVKAYAMTDRPVYRPAQKVNFKLWINQAQYDREGKSPFAGRQFAIQIVDPRGQKVHTATLQADEYGAISGDFELKKDATLGMYYIGFPNGGINQIGGNSFRVEEYTKPEFEVTVKAPDKPVMLGEKISATIDARYYFGAPVVNATVKYKVLRSGYDERWYPIMPWDWLFGRGYWWFAYDYTWYPGWGEWGTPRPEVLWHRPGWWAPPQQPEVVAEAEVPVGPDGTIKVEIDTAVAKAVHGDQDHKYTITAEVTDASRRTIVGSGEVLVARKPFKVYAWVNRGHYNVGDTVHAHFQAQTLDRRPVAGKGELKLLAISYEKDEAGNLTPVEKVVEEWDLDTNAEGRSDKQINARKAGQYRLSYKVVDEAGHEIEGGYVFTIVGEGFDGESFRFNEIELVPDKSSYAPDERVKLQVNTAQADSHVLLFVRAANGAYKRPLLLALDGKSTMERIEVLKKDMPNFFVEALTIHGGAVHNEVREIVVPPEKRVLDVQVSPSADEYKPGAEATVEVMVKDSSGEPFEGDLTLTMYDKAVEYISGGSNVPEIKEFFWKWRRHHNVNQGTSLDRREGNLTPPDQDGMGFLGVFGQSVATEMDAIEKELFKDKAGPDRTRGGGMMQRNAAIAPSVDAPLAGMAAMEATADDSVAQGGQAGPGDGQQGQAMVEPTVRTQFADTALWAFDVKTGPDGKASFTVKMPENLTTWKTRVWAMGDGTRVGEGTAEAVTTKDLIVRLQAPRFFVEKDEVVISANVHNYLKTAKNVKVVLELEGGTLEPVPVDGKNVFSGLTLEIPANGEIRVDGLVRAVKEGQATIRVKALTDEESDAMEMSFPVRVHGILKTDSFSGAIRPEGDKAAIEINVPKERRPAQSRLEVRYSPSLAMAMVDALPYLASYPYGCTEQTLNRFLPTVLTQKTLVDMGIDLKAVKEKRTNLNAQEIGDDVERAKQWKRFDHNPVFDEAEVKDMVQAGLEKLADMQNADGGWDWFSGWRAHSDPHLTALLVHGLQQAKAADVAVVPGMLDKGVAWLKSYQQQELRKLLNGRKEPPVKPWKRHPSNLDAFVFMVLVDAGHDEKQMREILYEDRNHLAVYAKAMLGLAMHKLDHKDERDMLIRNIEQFLEVDKENQTAWLRLPEGRSWWMWYESEYEAMAYYLKLLAVTEPKSEKASGLVKYLVNNRKHATWWNSTRDTAICVEAIADYIRATGEAAPDMLVEIYIDGKASGKEVRITADNLFTYDNKLVLTGEHVTTGKHTVELRKKGKGPLYFNAYLTNFTLEDPIEAAGLEIKVARNYYKLTPVDKAVKDVGDRGQVLDKKVEKYERTRLESLAEVTSGDLVEIELILESKNDYEYIMVEDLKAAGLEPFDIRSGYGDNEMGAYMELRDEKVTFFVRRLARGRHSISYRMRAEVPGKFSALPTLAGGMYAPELRANSDEFKIRIADRADLMPGAEEEKSEAKEKGKPGQQGKRHDESEATGEAKALTQELAEPQVAEGCED